MDSPSNDALRELRHAGFTTGLVTLTLIAALNVAPLAAQTATRPAATPIEPVGAIVDAFRTHALVALGEGAHNNEQGHRFRLGLIRDPRFIVVDDIIVESGNARYQPEVDRYTSGENVSDEALREARENTTMASSVWDRPMYDELLRTVREVNRTRPAARRLRVLLGDPPIDWASVRTTQEYLPWLRQRDAHVTALIQREVLDRKRRALIIYGDGHLQARSERPSKTLTAAFQERGTTLFTITTAFVDLATLQPSASSWDAPRLALLKGTQLGAASYEQFFGPPPPTDYFRANPRIEDHFDAMLYLGPPSAMTRQPLAYPRCTEAAYVARRVGRLELSGMPAAAADRLAKECAAAAPQ